MICEEDFRIVNEREKTLRVTIRSDDHSLSLDILVRASLRRREGERNRRREKRRERGVRGEDCCTKQLYRTFPCGYRLFSFTDHLSR